jgi:hypothetical protein
MQELRSNSDGLRTGKQSRCVRAFGILRTFRNVDQFDRIVSEVSTLAKRAKVQIPAPPERRTEPACSVVEAIKWSFLAKRALSGFAASENWRDSFSRLGPPASNGIHLLVSEYQRSELTVPPLSPIACFYPWLRRSGRRSVTRYTANGMSAIAGFLLCLAHAAKSFGHPIKLITTPLYWESQVLLRSWICEGLFNWECHFTTKGLLRSIRDTTEPHAIFLDSSGSIDTLSILSVLQNQRTSPFLFAVGWDNTCVSFLLPVQWTNVAVPLYIVRSHIKLDQLGLEITSLGSITVVIDRDPLPPAARVLTGFLENAPRFCQLLGINASADALRRLYLLGLPDESLTCRHNMNLSIANRVGSEELCRLLKNRNWARLLVFPHRCFSVLRLPFLKGRGAGEVTRLARDLHNRASERDLPLINSAGFGFAFTAVLGYENTSDRGEDVPVLRVAFGGHDLNTARDIARLVVLSVGKHRLA